MKLPLTIAAIIARSFPATECPAEGPLNAISLVLKTPPPPSKVELIPSPRAGMVWVPGMWNYVCGWYTWQNGGWELDRKGQCYVQAEWKQCAAGWQLHHGYWQELPRNRPLAEASGKMGAVIPYDPLGAYR
ncbi:hypothetical protein [Glaciimonas immobilis]|uniref:Uncharacterized protein n=1 Tax=Glaciimonas immobilis TaxID=728004 RepID=A0A840S0Z5_9BURK|nr:hypothetical protein [Glaciimonas immobilis]KAF3996280.1 hypothetical protein HAV38_19675 [Glaciimonas immobilis]MBB5202300.1 hypothetical protein [Glaciimonas immobilis]